MITKQNVIDAINSPELAFEYVYDIGIQTRNLFQNDEYFKSIDFLLNEFTGYSIYVPYTFAKQRNNLVECLVHDMPILVDLADQGLSYEILIHGIREPLAGEVFSNQLENIQNNIDNVTIIEAGANIGYYTIQEAAILKEQASIYAFEPVPDNVHLLKKNIRRNGLDQVTVVEAAVGADQGTVPMVIGNESNWAHVSSDQDETELKVDLIDLDRFCDDQNIDPSSINIVRMDIEGYEYNVIKGMRSILEESEDLLLFMELHTRHLRKEGKLKELLQTLDEYGFEVASVARRRNELNIDDIMDLAQVKGCPNIFLKKSL